MATRTTDPDLQARWAARAEAHHLIRRALRDVPGGHAQHGAGAAREAKNVMGRIDNLNPDISLNNTMLAAFDKRFIRIDARLVELIEDGVRNKTILRRTKLPRLDLDSPRLVKPLRERVAPIENPGDSELLGLVATHLRSAIEPVEPPPDAARSSAELYSAIVTESTSRTAGVPRSSRSAPTGRHFGA